MTCFYMGDVFTFDDFEGVDLVVIGLAYQVPGEPLIHQFDYEFEPTKSMVIDGGTYVYMNERSELSKPMAQRMQYEFKFSNIPSGYLTLKERKTPIKARLNHVKKVPHTA